MQDLERVLFETGENTENVESYMGACSSGQGVFNRDNVQVVGPIALDCTGETFGVPWRTDACSADDYFGWQYAVEQWCDDNGVDYRPYRHRVVLTSPGKGDWMTGGTEDCSWSGLGVVGALSYGRIYAKVSSCGGEEGRVGLSGSCEGKSCRHTGAAPELHRPELTLPAPAWPRPHHMPRISFLHVTSPGDVRSLSATCLVPVPTPRTCSPTPGCRATTGATRRAGCTSWATTTT